MGTAVLLLAILLLVALAGIPPGTTTVTGPKVVGGADCCCPPPCTCDASVPAISTNYSVTISGIPSQGTCCGFLDGTWTAGPAGGGTCTWQGPIVAGDGSCDPTGHLLAGCTVPSPGGDYFILTMQCGYTWFDGSVFQNGVVVTLRGGPTSAWQANYAVPYASFNALGTTTFPFQVAGGGGPCCVWPANITVTAI